MRTVIFREIPDAYTSISVAADDFSLVGVYHDIVYGVYVAIATLDRACSSFPDLDSTVLGARDHPFSFAVKGDARYVGSVAFEGVERVWVRGLDVVEFHGVVACRREEALVRRNAESVYLGIRMLDCSGADA